MRSYRECKAPAAETHLQKERCQASHPALAQARKFKDTHKIESTKKCVVLECQPNNPAHCNVHGRSRCTMPPQFRKNSSGTLSHQTREKLLQASHAGGSTSQQREAVGADRQRGPPSLGISRSGSGTQCGKAWDGNPLGPLHLSPYSAHGGQHWAAPLPTATTFIPNTLPTSPRTSMFTFNTRAQRALLHP